MPTKDSPECVAVELREPFRRLPRVRVVQHGQAASSRDLEQLCVDVDVDSAFARRTHAVIAEERIDVIGARQFGALDPEHAELGRRRRSVSRPGPCRVGRKRRRLRIGIRRALRGVRPEVDLSRCRGFAERAKVRRHDVVVRDRQDREAQVVKRLDDLAHRMAAVALQRMHVQIRSVVRERPPVDVLVRISQRHGSLAG